jgi:hypothetical protein
MEEVSAVKPIEARKVVIDRFFRDTGTTELRIWTILTADGETGELTSGNRQRKEYINNVHTGRRSLSDDKPFHIQVFIARQAAIEGGK